MPVDAPGPMNRTSLGFLATACVLAACGGEEPELVESNDAVTGRPVLWSSAFRRGPAVGPHRKSRLRDRAGDVACPERGVDSSSTLKTLPRARPACCRGYAG